MRFISTHFESYWVSEVPALINEEKNISGTKPPIVLTFDDGLYNNNAIAAPFIDKYNLKATFFVCSGLADGKSMLWNHELRCRLELLSSSEVDKLTDSRCTSNTTIDVLTFIESVKRWPESDKNSLISLLRDTVPEPAYSPQMLTDYLIMSVDELNALPACIELGNHTRSHPILTSLKKSDIFSQIVTSKDELAQLVNRDIDVFCYPNGMSNIFCKKLVFDNYKVAVTTDEGFASSCDGLNLLKRIPAANNLLDLVWRLVRPTA